MIVFILMFLTIYGAIHAYAYLRLRPMLPPGWGAYLAAFFCLMCLCPILLHLVERTGSLLLATLMAYFSYIWMAFLLLFVSSAFFYDLYRLFISLAAIVSRRDLSRFLLSPAAAAQALAALSLALLVYGCFEATQVRLKTVTIPTTKLPLGIKEFSIAQICDLHLGLLSRETALRRVLEQIEEADADILVCTGDLVDGTICDAEGLREILSKVKPGLGKFAVTGNHEFYAGLEKALEFTRQSGFTLLRGEAQDAAGIITVAGVDDSARDHAEPPRGPSEAELLRSLPRDRFLLLLKHTPTLKRESLGLFDLQLSGHSHGGQIFPFHLFVWRRSRYLAGLYPLSDGSHIYVSRGCGTWGPPVRFLAPPEVTLIKLVPAE